jgi:periplasmic divalent cation tolerance protein
VGVSDDIAATPIDVTVTCGSADEAVAIIEAVVGARLAACGQTWPLTSRYRWRGETAVDEEHLVLLKTIDSHFDAICDVIRSHHSYELPAITAVPLSQTGPGYLEWLVESTQDQA